MSMMKKAFYFGLGALTLTKEKAEKFYNEMLERGEISKEEARQFVDEAVKRGEEEKEEIRTLVGEELKKFKSDVSFATKAELKALEARISELEKRLQ